MRPRSRLAMLLVAATVASCRRAGCAARHETTMSGTSASEEIEEQAPENGDYVARLHPALPSPLTIPIGGQSLVVELIPDTPRFAVTAQSYVTLVFRTSGPPLEFEFGSAPGGVLDRPENITAAFRTTDGRVLPQARRGGDDYNGGSGWTLVRPEVRRRLRLASWASRLVPGHYFFHLETRVRARIDPSAPWQDVDVRIETPVDVMADGLTTVGR